MPIAKVQHQRTSTNNRPSIAVTMTGPVVAGNVWSAFVRAGVALASITAPAGWTARKTQDDGAQSCGFWDHVVAGGDSQAVTFTFGANNDATLVVFELSDVAVALSDGTSGANAGVVTSVQPGPITPTAAGDAMLVGLTTLTDNGGGQTIDGQFVGVSAGQASFVAYKIKSDSGAENPTLRWTTAADAAVVMVAYKAADAGPGGGGGGGGTTLTPQPWNPWNPLTVGMEWVPRVNPAKAIDNDGTAWAERFVSSVAETIDSVQLYTPAVPSTGRIAVEIYERGDEPCGVETTDTYRPSADVANVNPQGGVGLWRNQAGLTTAGTLYQSIDEATLDVADFVEAQGSAYGAELRMRMGTGAFADGRRVTQIRVVAVVACYGANTLGLKIRNTSTGAEWQANHAGYFGQQTLTSILPEICPWTLYPWTPADIRAFATGYEVSLQHPTSNPQSSFVLQLWMEVDSVPENRVAVTSAIFAQGAVGWATLALRTPAGADNWAKASGVEYSVAARRITDRYYPGGSVLWSYLDLGDGCPLAGHHVGYWLVDAKGCYAVDTEIDYPVPAFALNFVRTDAAVSVDSQPYAALGVADVLTGVTVEQTMTAPAGAYGRIRSRVKRQSETTEPLTVQLVGHGTAETLTIEESDLLPDATGGWKLLDLELAAAATVSGAVTLQFSSTDAVGWQITYLDTKGAGSVTTFGGTAARATIAGVDYVDRDLIATISTLPTTPSAFTATIGSTGLASPLSEPTTLDYVRMTWSASTLGVLFAAYVVERWDPVTGMWRPIARLLDATKPVFHDFEGRRGVAVGYRARTERADGALSQATLEVSATPTVPERPVLLLTSNEDPARNLMVVRQTAQGFSFLDSGRDQLRALFGRDGWVALREAESRFDQFSVTAFLAMDAVATDDAGVTSLVKPGRFAFDQLLALSRAEASYICVLDEMGGRWFSHLGVPGGQRSRPLYSADVVVTELTRTPSTPNVVPTDFVPPPPPPSTGPPTFRSVTNVTNTGTVTKPAGTAQFDALVGVMWSDTVSSLPSATGFSLLAYRDGIGVGNGWVGVFLRFAGGSEGASYTFTMPGSTGSAISLLAYDSTSVEDPLLVDVGVWQPGSLGSPHDVDGTSIDVDAPSTLLFVAAGNDTTPFVAPSDMVSRAANFHAPTGGVMVADQAVAIGATGDRTGQAGTGGDYGILLAFKGGATAPGGGLPPPDPGTGPVGYIGCSNTQQSAAGYRRKGGTRFWNSVQGYGGGAVSVWADPNDEHWDAFDRALAIEDQPVAIWWEFCEHGGDVDTQAELYAAAVQVLAILEARCPNVPIYLSALNGYATPDPEIPTAGMTAAAAQMVSEGLVYAGPHMEDILLTEDELEPDQVHPNTAGEDRMGLALKAWWDVFPHPT